MHRFAYHRPQTVEEAARILASDDEAKILAGGHTLIPTMKQRLASPSALVDLGRVASLKGISKHAGSLTIGAMTTHGEIENSPEIREMLSGLCDLAAGIGDPHVRKCGTIGGSLANNDPAADYPAAVLALGAVIGTNKRDIAADDFFQGLFATALEEGEIITHVTLPVPEQFAYAKFPNPASRYALVGVALAKGVGGVRVAVTGAGSSGVFRHAEMERALERSWTPDALSDVSTGEDELLSDLCGDAAYRAHLVGVMARRALQKTHRGFPAASG